MVWANIQKHLSYYEKAHDIWLAALNLYHPTLFSAHNNIGSVHIVSMGQHSKALVIL